MIQPPECPIFGAPPTSGTALNEEGNLVGYHWQCHPNWGNEDAFFWSPESGLVDLPRPPESLEARAYDLNDNGQVVGHLRMSGPTIAGMWQGGQVVELGALPGAKPFSEALAINNVGQIVGYSATQDLETGIAAVIWQSGQIASLDLPAANSIASDINESGQIVGWYGQANHIDSHAYFWSDGQLIDIGVLPGGFTGEGRALNDRGQVAGIGRLIDPRSGNVVFRSFVWESGVITDLGLLPGAASVLASDINNLGQAVGHCQPRIEGFIWQGGRMANLNDLIVTELDVHVSIAYGLNDSGQIAASGYVGNEPAALILTPVTTAGDLNGDCRVGTIDLLTLLANWGPCLGCPADIDEDGVVGTSDLLLLLTNWG